MTKTITFKQEDKKVYEVLKEIKASGWNRSGNLRTMLRVGAIDNITREQAVLLAKHADKGEEAFRQIFESLEKDVAIKLEEESKEITFAEAMERMNDKLETVRAEHMGDTTTISKYESVSDMMVELGIRDFDDLSEVKFFTVVK